MSINKETKDLLVAAVRLAYEYYQDKETRDKYLTLLKWIKNVEPNNYTTST